MRGFLVLFAIFLFLCAQSALGSRSLPSDDPEDSKCSKGKKKKQLPYLIIDADVGCGISASAPLIGKVGSLR